MREGFKTEWEWIINKYRQAVIRTCSNRIVYLNIDVQWMRSVTLRVVIYVGY